MSNDAEKPAESQPRPRTRPRWALRAALVLAAVLLLLLVLVAALPSLLSTHWARNLVVAQLSQATGRPAALEGLEAGWRSGLRLTGLRIGAGTMDDPGFLCSLDTLRADLGFDSLFGRKVWAEVELNGLRLRHEPSAAPPPAEPETPAKPLPQTLKDGLGALRGALAPKHFSGDLRARVRLSDIQALALAGNSTLRVTEAALELDAPSLRKQPVRLTLATAAQLDGKALPPLTLQAEAADLVDQQRLLRPGQARINAKAQAQGLALTITGSLATGLKADLLLNLRELLTPLRPLLPPSVPAATGSLAVGATLTLKGQDALAASLLVFADALSLSGGSLGTRSVGPLQLNLLQEAAVDLAAGGLELPGTLTILKGSKAAWTGRATGLAQAAPELSLKVDALRLDVAELLRSLRGFLPPDVKLAAATLDAEGLEATVALPAKQGGRPGLSASAHGLAFTASGLQQGPAARRVTLGRTEFRLDRLAVSLPAGNTGSAELDISSSAENFRLAGPKTVTMRRAALTTLAVRGADLVLDPAALFGLAGRFGVELASEATGLEVAGTLAIPTATKAQTLRAELPPASTATLVLERSRADMPGLRLLRPGKKPLDLPVAIRAEVPAISVSRAGEGAPLVPSVRDAHMALDIGTALRADLTTSLSGGRELASRGSLSLDADKLLALASAVLPQKAKGSGALALDWDLAATLPQAGPRPTPRTLSEQVKALAFLHRAEATLNLREISLDWPLEPKPGGPRETLRLRGLTTPRALRLATREGLGESSLVGSLAFGPLAELPGTGALSRPIKGLFTLSAAQQGLRSAQVSQMLTAEGLGLTQNLSLTVDKLDAVLDREDRLAAALELADATASFGLKTGLDALPPVPAKGGAGKGLSGKGALELGADLRLAGGRSLALAARLASPGLDLSLGPELSLLGLRSDLALRRRYALRPGLACPGATAEAERPLSEQVFDLFPGTAAPPGAQPPGAGGFGLRSLYDGLAQRKGSLGFAELNLKPGPLPLSLRDFALSLDTSGPIPAIQSFRLGLFGGSILGSAAVRGASGSYTVEADCAFTGVDTGRMLPARAEKDLGDQAELSGRVSLRVPLTPDPETLLTRMSLRADITKVGPRTLERALYALDPDEQNETIVQQRRLMGIGYPRFLHVGLAYGNLSLSGEVEVKGFRLDIPPIDRLAVANLPIRRQLGPALANVPKLVNLLDLLSATSICSDASALRSSRAGSLNLSATAPREGATP